MTMTTTEKTPTAAQIKRYIGGNGSMLVLAEHEGAMWATNRFWAVRAAHLEPFLRKHSIDGPGVYDVASTTVSRREEPADPRIFSRILDLASYTVPLEHVTIEDYDEVYAQGRDGLLLLLQRSSEAETSVTAVPVDQLNWLEGAPVQAPGSQMCNMELFATRSPSSPSPSSKTGLANSPPCSCLCISLWSPRRASTAARSSGTSRSPGIPSMAVACASPAEKPAASPRNTCSEHPNGHPASHRPGRVAATHTRSMT